MVPVLRNQCIPQEIDLSFAGFCAAGIFAFDLRDGGAILPLLALTTHAETFFQENGKDRAGRCLKISINWEKLGVQHEPLKSWRQARG